MGFFKDIKNLLWASKSVGKHAAEKGIEHGKEVGGELLDDAKGMATNIGGKLKDKAGALTSDAFDMAKDTAGKMVDKAGDIVESAKETGAEMMDKATDVANDVKNQVTEKAADAMDATKDAASKVTEKAGDVADGAKNMASNTVDSTEEALKNLTNDSAEGLGDAADLGEDFLDDAGDAAKSGVDGGKNVLEKIGGDVLAAGAVLLGKTGEVAENLGSKVLEKGDELYEKGKTSGLGDDLGEMGDKILDKAKEIGGDLKDKGEALVDRANKVASGEAEIKSLSDTVKEMGEKFNKPTEFSDEIGYENAKGSLLEGKDDFFDKMSKYADGEYSAFDGDKLADDAKDDVVDKSNDLFKNTKEILGEDDIDDI